LPDILSVKRLPYDRADAVLRHRGEKRIGRIFPFQEATFNLDTHIGILAAIGGEQVVVPDLWHRLDETRCCFSMPADSVQQFDGRQLSFDELREPLDELHGKGFLNLDVTSASYMLCDDKPVLVNWGDCLFAPLNVFPPEIVGGGFACTASDYFILGNLLSSGNFLAWNGEGAPNLKTLCSASPWKRLQALGAPLPGIIRKPGMPRTGAVTLVKGGSWQERDLVVNEFISAACARNWSISVIRCRPQESHRPLPGAEPGEKCIDSAWALTRALFPVMSGVNRLLVVDHLDYASEDLRAILGELSARIPENLALVATSTLEEVDLFSEQPIELNLGEFISRATSLDPVDALRLPQLSGYPDPQGEGYCYRTDDGMKAESLRLSAAELYSEGAYRYLISEEGRNLAGSETEHVIADSYSRLGMHERTLELLPEDEFLRRGRACMGLGHLPDARKFFEKAVASESESSDARFSLAECLIEAGELSDAEELLGAIPGVASILRQSQLLDTLGRVDDALELVKSALADTISTERIQLLCALSGLNMRQGSYDRALIAVNEAVMLAKPPVEIPVLRDCLVTRGQVREVLGLWDEALDDYRLAGRCAREMLSRPLLSTIVHQYVLELRMGQLKEAFGVWKEFQSDRVDQESIGYWQLFSQLSAYTGVLLGRGSRALSSADRAITLASDHGFQLRHGLSLLYRGQLLAQDNQLDEAVDSLKHSRQIASLIGDRHLILLADLALSRISPGMKPERSVKAARQLGLRLEELEAIVIKAEDGTSRDEALKSLLDLPAPLKACELASGFGLPVDCRLRNRLLRVFGNLCSLLEGDDLDGFRRMNSTLHAASDSETTGSRSVGTELLQNQIEQLSRWIPGYVSGKVDLRDLSEQLGLESICEQPRGVEGEIAIDSPLGSTLFVCGADVSGARLLQPVISSVISIHNPEPADALPEATDYPEIIGRSRAISAVRIRMDKIAESNVPVLITGETGTGKELVARGLHRKSGCHGQFVALDCGAIPENLIEAELFGAVRGAYTDSVKDRKGLLESADGGTLFLDEIGNLPMRLQPKLLRVLDSGVLRRVGDTEERQVSFRLITATNSSLPDRIEEGSFRADLFYRISVLLIDLPPLRDRLEDIPLLVRHFANIFTDSGKPVPSFTRSSMEALMSYSWPGNVRELMNTLQRTLLLGNGEIVRETDISFDPVQRTGESNCRTLEQATAAHVYSTWIMMEKSTRRASEVLKCDPKTVRKYLRLYRESNGI
jgi:DNA-binding NtrC family response regulator/tetratricopeptide (TPR) repeat protein